MSKLLLFITSFITIIISINCGINKMCGRSQSDIDKEQEEFYKQIQMSSKSQSDIDREQEEFYKQIQSISRVKHAGHLPLLTASEIITMVDGLHQIIEKLSKDKSNFKVHRQLVSLKEQLKFRLKFKLYKPENSNETNKVRMIHRTEDFNV